MHASDLFIPGVLGGCLWLYYQWTKFQGNLRLIKCVLLPTLAKYGSQSQHMKAIMQGIAALPRKQVFGHPSLV